MSVKEERRENIGSLQRFFFLSFSFSRFAFQRQDSGTAKWRNGKTATEHRIRNLLLRPTSVVPRSRYRLLLKRSLLMSAGFVHVAIGPTFSLSLSLSVDRTPLSTSTEKELSEWLYWTGESCAWRNVKFSKNYILYIGLSFRLAVALSVWQLVRIQRLAGQTA